MQSEPITVEISSECDSPVIPVTIMEEIASMQIGLSSVSKKKRNAQKYNSLAPQKRQTRTSTRVVEEVAQTGPSIS